MAKSIRSKIKRKHRTEFRRTVGEQAARANMKITQAKLRECMEKGTMTSVSRLSSVLDTTEHDEPGETVGGSDAEMDAATTRDGPVDATLRLSADDASAMDASLLGQEGGKGRSDKAPVKANVGQKTKKKKWQVKKVSKAVKRKPRTNGKKKNMCSF